MRGGVSGGHATRPSRARARRADDLAALRRVARRCGAAGRSRRRCARTMLHSGYGWIGSAALYWAMR